MKEKRICVILLMRPLLIRNVSGHIIPLKTNRSLLVINLNIKVFQSVMTLSVLKPLMTFLSQLIETIHAAHHLCPVNSNIENIIYKIQIGFRGTWNLVSLTSQL